MPNFTQLYVTESHVIEVFATFVSIDTFRYPACISDKLRKAEVFKEGEFSS